MIFVYRTPTGWGSVARSRDPGLHGRKPLFATPRALALSYYDEYIDFTGRVKAYGVANLRVLEPYDWRLSEKNVWKVEQMLIDWPHRRIRTSDAKSRRDASSLSRVPRGARLQAVEVLQGRDDEPLDAVFRPRVSGSARMTHEPEHEPRSENVEA